MYSTDRQIGRNIKAIRNANGMNIIDFASYIKTEDKEEGISDSLLEKIENGRRHATDEIIRSIARHTGFSFSEIKYGDLSYLKKDERVLPEKIHFLEFFHEKEDIESYIECLRHFLQIAEEKEAMQSEDFQKGMKILKEKIQPLCFTIEECLNAIDSFEKSISDGVDGTASINILSCSLYLYLKMIGESLDEEKISVQSDSNVGCDIDLFSQIQDEMKGSSYELIRRQFIQEYDSLFTRHMRRLALDKENSDFAYYFLFIRYELGLFDEKDIQMNNEEMKIFSASFFDSLYKMENKYALLLHDYLESLKSI